MDFSDLAYAIGRLPPGDILRLFASRRRLRRWLPVGGLVTPKGYPHPFYFRNVTTDPYVIVEVLLREQYACLRGLDQVGTIIDAGANIGTASVFLLNAYPRARVIALEPDPGNFAVLERNLRAYGSRAVAVRCALWHQSEPLRIQRGNFRDGGEWSTQVESAPAEATAAATVDGMTMTEIMAAYGIDTVDILKIDIEGAEQHVFEAQSHVSWLGCIRNIAIELHNPAAREAFARAIATESGDVAQVGEVTVWRRRH